MAVKSLTDLLTPEQIDLINKGELTLSDIKIELPTAKSSKVNKFKEGKDTLLSWVDNVTKDKTTEDSVPEFWLVLQYLCQINYQDGAFDLESEVPSFQNFLDCCEAEHTTVDMLTVLTETVPFHNTFLKKCAASSLVTRARKKSESVVEETDDTPFS